LALACSASVRTLEVSFSGARKKVENRIIGRSLEGTVEWAIELVVYYSDLVDYGTQKQLRLRARRR